MPEFTTTDGVRLHYAVRGRGPVTLLYLHGMGQDGETWREAVDRLDPETYRHVTFDFRGHGRSQSRPAAFTTERLARDALELADLVEADRFFVIGHSYGAKVGMLLAALAPDRVVALVLLGPVGPGTVPLEREPIGALLDTVSDPARLRAVLAPWYVVWSSPAVERAVHVFARTPRWALEAVAEQAMWTDISATVGLLRLPALVMTGTHDPVYGADFQTERVLPFLAEASLVSINCGHGFMLERPDDVARECDRFVRRVVAAPRMPQVVR